MNSEKVSFDTDKRRLRRDISLSGAVSLVVGSIIGTGIFFFIADAGRLLPSIWWVAAVWVAGGLLAMSGALCVAELASRIPATGGIYLFLREAFGGLIAFEYAWLKFFVMRTGSYSIQMLAFATFFCQLLNINTSENFHVKLVATSGLWVLFAVNSAGVIWGSRLQSLLTSIKVLALVAIVGSACFKIISGNAPAYPLTIIDSRMSWQFFFLALIPVMWTFGGWDESPFVAGEVINPVRNIPISIVGGLGLCCLLFVLVNISYVMVLGMERFAGSSGETATLFMNETLGAVAASVLSGILVISTFGATNGMLLTGARIGYAAGQDHTFFRFFYNVASQSRSPVRSLAFQCGLATVAIWFAANPFQLLLYTGLAYWLFSALLPIALLILRQRDSKNVLLVSGGRFQCPLHPLPAIIFFLGSWGMLVAVIADDWPRLADATHWLSAPPNTLVTLLLLLGGYFAYRLRKGSDHDQSEPKAFGSSCENSNK